MDDLDSIERLPQALALAEAAFPELTSSEPISKAKIARYYDRAFWGYTLFHSREGAVHMALGDRGFDVQAAEIASFVPAEGPVLEIGCGRGYNLAYLAARHPGSNFTGIDYSHAHVRTAQRKMASLVNAQASHGDFHALAFDDGQFPLIYAVETLCHAQDYPTVLAELFRVLAPGGRLVIFDGFRSSDTASDDMAKAIRYSEAAMAVPAFAQIDAFKRWAKQAGFAVAENSDRTADILPNLRHMARRARSFYARPMLRRVITAVAPRELTQNSVAALLMATTCQAKAHSYRRLVFSKPG